MRPVSAIGDDFHVVESKDRVFGVHCIELSGFVDAFVGGDSEFGEALVGVVVVADFVAFEVSAIRLFFVGDDDDFDASVLGFFELLEHVFALLWAGDIAKGKDAQEDGFVFLVDPFEDFVGGLWPLCGGCKEDIDRGIGFPLIGE